MQNNKYEAPEYRIIKKKQINKILLYLDTQNIYKASIIEAYYNKDENKMYIIDLETKPKCRGNGFASILIKKIIDEAIKLKCNKIELDDASEYFQRPDNIYIKFGFEYINKGQPEMIKYL